MNPHCDLCRLHVHRELKSTLHHEDERYIVVDCIICHTPMVVKKAHEANFTFEEKSEVGKLLIQLFGTSGVIDWEQRKIPDHAHCHLRPYAFPNSSAEPLIRYA